MVVVDASVVVKVLTQEAHSDAAAERLATETDRIAPDWVRIEVANALARKVRRSGLPLELAHRYRAALPVVLTEMVDTSGLIDAAFDLSVQIDHPLYDCAYLELAIRRDALLLTADRGLADAARGGGLGRYVELLA